MIRPTSPRLSGVPILLPEVTGSEYARWRRSLQSALETDNVWGHCDGTFPMPMPAAGPHHMSPIALTSTPQPSLLQERRVWVRKDRKVKLDIFLSLAEEVMQDVFQVGPPLPPSNLNAKEMLDALDKRFAVFRFEDYHHAFCHFLNLHIDQYTTLEEFNTEFQAALDDMFDYGCPLSNTQACSAYFSKLRCTQNSWVAKKLEEWDTQSSEPGLIDLIKESPSWAVVRSLSNKTISDSRTDSIQEVYFESPVQSDNEGGVLRRSDASTLSTVSSHSNKTASTTARSQEIVVHASEDIVSPSYTLEELTGIDISDFPKVPTFTAAQNQEPNGARQSVLPMQHPIPIDRPLPPVPGEYDNEIRKSTSFPAVSAESLQNSSQAGLELPIESLLQPTPTQASRSSKLKLETTHPTLQPKTPHLETSRTQAAFDKEINSPDVIHPALRSTPPHTAPLPASKSISFNPSISSPNLRIPWPSTPIRPDRPHTSLAFTSHHDHHPLFRIESTSSSSSSNSSTLSLPLQGTGETITPPKSTTHPPPLTFKSSQSQSRSQTFTFGTLRSRTPTFESLRVLRPRSPLGDGLSGEARASRKRDRKKTWGFGVNVVAALKGGK